MVHEKRYIYFWKKYLERTLARRCLRITVAASAIQRERTRKQLRKKRFKKIIIIIMKRKKRKMKLLRKIVGEVNWINDEIFVCVFFSFAFPSREGERCRWKEERTSEPFPSRRKRGAWNAMFFHKAGLSRNANYTVVGRSNGHVVSTGCSYDRCVGRGRKKDTTEDVNSFRKRRPSTETRSGRLAKLANWWMKRKIKK